MKKRGESTSFLLLVSLLFALGFSSCSKDDGPTSRHIETIDAEAAKEIRAFETFQTDDATLFIAKKVTLTAPVSGILLEGFVDSTQAVEAGREIAILDLKEIELNLAAKKSSLRLIQAQEDQGPIEREPPQADIREDEDNLNESPPPEEPREPEPARDRKSLIEERVEELQNEIALLEYQADKGRVTAPFAGTLIPSKTFYAGESIKEGDPLYTLVATDLIQVRALVPLKYGGHLGGNASFSFIPYAAPDQTFTGWVKSSNPSAENVALFELVGEIENLNGALKEGQTGSIRVETTREISILTIPAEAVVKPDSRLDAPASAGSGPAVFVIDDDRASLQRVKLGLTYGDRVEVEDGLSEGDVVATSSLDFLMDGERVKIREKAPKAPPPSL